MPKSHPARTDRYEAALVEANRGHFARALKLLSPIAETGDHLSQRELMLTADLLQHTGDTERAARIAGNLFRSKALASAFSSRCLTILGIGAFEAGNLRRSTELLQKAVRVGDDSLDDEARCHAMLCLLARLTDVSAPGSTASLASDTGRLVAKVNTNELTIRFHLILGRTEGRRGILDAADQHFHIARSLLDMTPNPWLEGLYCVDACIVSYMRTDLAEALRLANRALSRSQRSGHQRTLAAALVNLGSIYRFLSRMYARRIGSREP